MVGGLTVSTVMKLKRYSLVFAFVLTSTAGCLTPAFAQDDRQRIEIKPPEAITPKTDQSPLDDIDTDKTDIITDEPSAEALIEKPDYSQLTPQAERRVRLDEIFKRLQAETDPEDADLIAEEIWALWLDSGSASIDFVLRRGTAAQKRGDMKLARRMFDHVTALSPDYAEGWARSSRLALEEKDLSRTLTEAAQTLILEPRHFFALWTIGNVFEQLDRQEEALEAYREAHKLYPALEAVKDRLEALKSDLDGDVL